MISQFAGRLALLEGLHPAMVCLLASARFVGGRKVPEYDFVFAFQGAVMAMGCQIVARITGWAKFQGPPSQAASQTCQVLECVPAISSLVRDSFRTRISAGNPSRTWQV